MLTYDDRKQIRNAQLRRLHELLPDGEEFVLMIDMENCLHICTQQQAHYDRLLLTEAELLELCWIVSGADYLVLWLNNQRTWEAPTRATPEGCEVQRLGAEDLELLTTEILKEVDMPTATLEKPTTAPAKSAGPADLPQTNGRLPGQNIAAIASDLEMEVNELRQWLESVGAEIIPYNNEEIVAGGRAIAAYQFFEPTLIQRRMAKRGLAVPQLNGTAAQTTGDAPAKKSTPSKPKATASKPTTGKKAPAQKSSTRKKTAN